MCVRSGPARRARPSTTQSAREQRRMSHNSVSFNPLSRDSSRSPSPGAGLNGFGAPLFPPAFTWSPPGTRRSSNASPTNDVDAFGLRVDTTTPLHGGMSRLSLPSRRSSMASSGDGSSTVVRCCDCSCPARHLTRCALVYPLRLEKSLRDAGFGRGSSTRTAPHTGHMSLGLIQSNKVGPHHPPASVASRKGRQRRRYRPC